MKIDNLEKSFCFTYESPVGSLFIECTAHALRKISFSQAQEASAASLEDCKLAQTLRLQLDEYFAGERTSFELPLDAQGTPFQKSVWKALCEIPYGKTCSYADIAARLGNDKACRAVGMANHNNPIAIVIPCHRVIGKNGALTGYAGGMEKKRTLLQLEADTLSRKADRQSKKEKHDGR